jgi:hypothetical protein
MLSNNFDQGIVEKAVAMRNNHVALDLAIFVAQKLFSWFILCILMYCGAFAFDLKIAFEAIMKVAVVASFAFIVSYGYRIAWFLFIDTDFTMTSFADFEPLSLYELITGEAKGWLFVDLVKHINLFEVGFIVVFSYGVTVLSTISFSQSLKAWGTSYAVIVTFWSLLIAFVKETLK